VRTLTTLKSDPRITAAALAVVLTWLLAVSPALSGGEGGILTFHGDAGRTGWNRTERTLTPATVASLRKLWTGAIEGEIYAQPLVVPGLAMFGRVRTVVYVVTDQNRIYALDAADGSTLWDGALGPPVPRAALPCGSIDSVGITSTPVVDRGAGTLYVAGLTASEGRRMPAYRVAALDVKSGTTRPGWPVEIAPPSVSGLRFDPGVQQRGGLTLISGTVYVPLGGYRGDCAAYHGWVVGIPVSAPTHQEAYATPAGRMGGGIWAPGGLAADAQGRLYVVTGNGGSGSPPETGNGVLRLLTSPLRFSGAPRDYFTLSNAARLSATNTDPGSTAPLVLPDLPGSSTPHLLFIAGKQGVAYLINRDDMGGMSHGTGIAGEAVYSRCVFGTCEEGAPAVASAAAYWDGGSAGRLILIVGHGRQPAPCAGDGGVVALRLALAVRTRTVTFSVAWCSASMTDAGPPAVSGEGPDGGVVWVVDHGTDALYALDAPSGDLRYVSRGADALHHTHRFITPSVWGGRVYVGAGHEVVAYGLQ
jgi:PQQ-like domain